jgi:UDPglucose--hexose-1-phosphate uridylyltransferase
MPELRKDPVTGDWVAIGTERPCRLESLRVAPAEPPPGACTLCEGNEHETPPELLAYRADPNTANRSGWRVRVVPSKFPLLRVEGDLERRGHGLYDLMNGIGAHEILVESPRHDASFATSSPAAVEEVLRAFQERLVDLGRDPRFRSVVWFKDADPPATPTAAHPHSQLLATPTVPLPLAHELAQARAYHDYRERCLFCDIVDQESEEGRRTVFDSEHVIGFVPFAARSPFETWFLPRVHASGYEDASAAERRDLAAGLVAVVERVRALLGPGTPALALHGAPLGERRCPYFHWHLELVPRVRTAGGAGAGGGLAFNPLPPEDAARLLRSDAG